MLFKTHSQDKVHDIKAREEAAISSRTQHSIAGRRETVAIGIGAKQASRSEGLTASNLPLLNQ